MKLLYKFLKDPSPSPTEKSSFIAFDGESLMSQKDFLPLNRPSCRESNVRTFFNGGGSSSGTVPPQFHSRPKSINPQRSGHSDPGRVLGILTVLVLLKARHFFFLIVYLCSEKGPHGPQMNNATHKNNMHQQVCIL